MQECSTIASVREIISKTRCSGRSIGFVPTMGALHQGHVALFQQAARENNLVVGSIFVNPTQFNDPADLVNYPRTLESDKALIKGLCDVLFVPSVSEMYPKGPEADYASFNFGSWAACLEGEHRPGHFNGVGQIVARLFNIVQPHRAYFGQKDLQQLLLVKKLVEDFCFDLEVVACPTVREADGLAMSSRNTRLSEGERALAPLLYQTLQKAAEDWQQGCTKATLEALVKSRMEQFPDFALEYFAVFHPDAFEPLPAEATYQSAAMLIAARLGNVRLIDNLLVATPAKLQ